MPLFSPEYFADRAAFAARYFRELFARLPYPGVLVFDNFQELDTTGNDPESALYEALLLGLMQAPIGTTMIFLSREAPPPAFARLRATEQMALLDWEALKLTAEESVAIVEMRCAGQPVARASALQLHRKTQGWVAGLLLLSERYMGAVPDEATRNEDEMGDAVCGSETQLLFDYLGHEIFRRASLAEQEFLLKTAPRCAWRRR